MTRTIQHHGVPSDLGDDAVRTPEPKDFRAAPEGADRRDAGGACRTVIGCGLTGGAADCDRLRRERLPKLTRSLRRSFDWSSV
jgi:hypothetical protein